MIRFDQHKEQESQDEDVLVATEREHEIILYNDDVNTFDHVIKTLIAVCELTHRNQCFDDMVKGVDVIIVQNDFMFTFGCNENVFILAFLFFMLVKSNHHNPEYTYFAQTQSSNWVFD